jgi:RNA recognition motif-containing protein
MIKSLLELKDYCCLSVENINRNFSYKDIKEAFNQYGPVKNIRINIDQKTGRFMGSVLIYYD